jgi:hypothetical protein
MLRDHIGKFGNSRRIQRSEGLVENPQWAALREQQSRQTNAAPLPL